MRGYVLLLVLFCPFWVFAQEHSVPVGTDDNLLILSVENALPFPLQGVRVDIRSAPEWLEFKTSSATIDSLPTHERREVEFDFRVLEVAGGQVDSVQLALTNHSGDSLGYRAIRFRTMSLPQETGLLLAYPNPGNPGSTIRYALRTSAQVRLEVYNILGQRVRMLVNEERPVGTWSVQWDGCNDHGHAVASGSYLVRLRAEEKETGDITQSTMKLILQR
ncbi:MAG: T9SS type A sorting domain-containing protein [candidate division KSB1 bacterium]|nr:T9SS type A sorting domain-containing protein [candidate division KSB1 bacterium]